jgi:hypothetical protein
LKKSKVLEILFLTATDLCPPEDEEKYKVYISLSEEMEPVDQLYFKVPACLGTKCFTNHGFEVLDSSHKGCKLNFVSLKKGPRNKWAFANEDNLGELPEWVKEKDADAAKEVDLDDVVEFTDNQQIREDFSIKLDKGEVSCCQEYYAWAKERSVAMGVKVAENMTILKNIEKLSVV